MSNFLLSRFECKNTFKVGLSSAGRCHWRWLFWLLLWEGVLNGGPRNDDDYYMRLLLFMTSTLVNGLDWTGYQWDGWQEWRSGVLEIINKRSPLEEELDCKI